MCCLLNCTFSWNRTFYFDSEDREEIGDWVMSLMRSRYREQNSDLLSLQETLNKSTVERKLEMDMLKRKGESDLLSLRSEMTSILQSALVLLGVTHHALLGSSGHEILPILIDH